MSFKGIKNQFRIAFKPRIILKFGLHAEANLKASPHIF